MRGSCGWIAGFGFALSMMGCEVRTSQSTPAPKELTGTFKTELVPQPFPNQYHVRVSWQGMSYAGSPILRTENGKNSKSIIRTRALSDEYIDEDVLAGENYEYSLEEPGSNIKSSHIRIPVDYVADTSAFQSCKIKGFHRLFINRLVCNEPADIDVEEIRTLQWDKTRPDNGGLIMANGGGHLIARPPAEKGKDGADGLNITIKAKRIMGKIFLFTLGENGGEGDTRGGSSGEVRVDVEEKLEWDVQVMVRRALNGKYLGTQGFEADRLAPLRTIAVKGGGRVVLSANDSLLPEKTEGLYQSLGSFLITPEGIRYDLTLGDREVYATKKDSIVEMGFAATGRDIFIGMNGNWKDQLRHETLKTDYGSLAKFIRATGNLKRALYPEYPVTTFVPAKMTALALEQSSLLETLVENKKTLVEFLTKRSIHGVVVSLENRSEFALQNNQLVIPRGNTIDPKEVLGAMESDSLEVNRE